MVISLAFISQSADCRIEEYVLAGIVGITGIDVIAAGVVAGIILAGKAV